MYQKELFIPFHLADPAGVVFFGHAFTLAHQALEAFVQEELALPWAIWFQHEEWLAPIRHAEADYVKPLRVGLPCTVEIEIAVLGDSSATFHYTFYQEQVKCCSVKTVHVFCDRLISGKRAI